MDSTPQKPKLKVINLFGAPGVGKSAARSGIFWLMKSLHVSVEEVSEYAKYLVMAGRRWQLEEEQLYLFSKQHHKQLIIAREGYEYAVTDSPLELCAFYAGAGYFQQFERMVDEVSDTFENVNFFLSRDLSQSFEDRGRRHNREEAIATEKEMREFLDKKGILYENVEVNLQTPWVILNKILPGLAKAPTF